MNTAKTPRTRHGLTPKDLDRICTAYDILRTYDRAIQQALRETQRSPMARCEVIDALDYLMKEDVRAEGT